MLSSLPKTSSSLKEELRTWDRAWELGRVELIRESEEEGGEEKFRARLEVGMDVRVDADVGVFRLAYSSILLDLFY